MASKWLLSLSVYVVGMTGFWLYAKPTEEQQCASKIMALETVERSSRADVFRSWAECKADQIEFGAASPEATACEANRRIMKAAAERDIESARARLTDADVVACQAITASSR